MQDTSSEMPDMIQTIRGSLTLLVGALVDVAESVEIGTTEGHSLVIFEIRCPQSEMGKIVGKNGRNIQALRTIMSAIGAKYRRRVQVEVIEPV